MVTTANHTVLSLISQECLDLSNNTKKKNPMIYPQIGNFLTNMPAYVDWKNTDSTYRGCSEHTALRLAGLSSSRDIVGKLDTDMCWGQNDDYNTYKQFYLGPDKQVLDGNVLVSIGNIFYGSDRDNKVVIIKKFPLLTDSNEIAGIISYLIDVTGQGIPNIIDQLKNLNVPLTASILTEAKRYTTSNYTQKLSLSKREEECLYYLLRNSTAKEIAKILNISHRTVESYLNNLKDKFNCINKTTLIIKAMELGFMNLIPDHILSEKYL